MHLKTTSALTAVALGLSGAAFAGGLDRFTFDPSLMYTEGDRVEFTYAITNPDVGASSFQSGAPSPLGRVTVAPNFDTFAFGYKKEFSDKFSLGLVVNSNPFGVHVDYVGYTLLSAGLGALNADLDGNSYMAIGKYQFSERFSAFGGVRYTETSGTANLPSLALAGAPDTTLNVDGSGTDFILGAAYEIPSIALRAALSYESGTELDPTVVGASGINYGTGMINVPEAWNLNFQTGIAQDTLMTLDLRYADWEGAQVRLPAALGSTQLSSFDNTIGVSLGLARRINENFAVSGGIYYEGSGTEPLSPLAPTNGITTLRVGGQYTAPSGLETSLGLSYSPRGAGIADTDNSGAVSATDLNFTDNKVITIGLKIAKSF